MGEKIDTRAAFSQDTGKQKEHVGKSMNKDLQKYKEEIIIKYYRSTGDTGGNMRNTADTGLTQGKQNRQTDKEKRNTQA